MEQVSLNLARKWRSAQFAEIVGQELIVRILQNSLFKNQFFPVYLMSGQRGCGKTSTARVFAAAVNCRKLAEFQNNPKIKIPCLVCDSCVAMQKGQHPDFIEIDAASYTGVDNIRNIIDTSSFLPILGSRKIYLIDEVHMLSKAAFNALLKLLEEPPKSVLFILATTEAQKLPDTVRSRCFQLLFSPIAHTQVTEHLKNICQQESIAYQDAGLETIAQVTQGSLRDALNLLEQARFAEATVSKASVLSVLGYVDDQLLYQLVAAIMQQDQSKLLTTLESFGNKAISIDYILKRLLEIMYDCIVIKYGGSAKYCLDLPEQLHQDLEKNTIQKLAAWFDDLCQLDMVLSKTSKKQLLLEAALLRLVLPEFQNHHLADDQKKNKSIKLSATLERATPEQAAPEQTTAESEDELLWRQFIQVVSAHVDPVLASILHSTQMVIFNRQQNIVEVITLKKFILFQDLFLQQKAQYQPYLNKIFGYQVTLVVQFTATEVVSATTVAKQNVPENQIAVSEKVLPKTVHNSYAARREIYQSKPLAKNERTLDVSDTQKWKITHSLLNHFGGTVREIIKDTHEFDA